MSELRTTTRTTYGFRDAATGALVRMQVEPNGPNNSHCGPYTCTLTTSPNCPIFETESVRDAAVIRAADCNWYNTDQESPGWGDLDGGEGLIPVRFEVVDTFDPRYPEPIDSRRTIHETDLPRAVVARKITSDRRAMPVFSKRYFGVLPPKDVQDITMAVFALPDDLVDAGPAGVILLQDSSSRLSYGIVLDTAPIHEDYPVHERDLERVEAGQQAVLCLVDGWASRPAPIDYAAWERVEPQVPAAGPRP